MKSRAAIIIPGRLDSQRFPNKLIQPLFGKPIIEHVIENAKKIDFKVETDIFMATDSDVLEEYGRKHNLKIFKMNPEDAKTGTERGYRFYQKNQEYDYYITVPADEPGISGEKFAENLTLEDLINLKDGCISFYSKFYNREDLESRFSCKIVTDIYSHVLYTSRAVIPSTKNGELYSLEYYKKHVAVHIFSREFFIVHGESIWDKTHSVLTSDVEGLEQNRFVELGAKMKMIKTKHIGIGIDSPEHLKSLEERIKNHKNL